MSVILGTRHNDILSALGDGDVVFGFQGDDYLISNFNRTALIGGIGSDTLTTDVDIATDTGFHGISVQDGGAGDDILNVNMHWPTLLPSDAHVISEVAVYGGLGDDQINIAASPLLVHSGSARSNLVTNNADGGAGDDHITIYGRTGFFTLDGTITNHATGGLGDDVLDATAILESITSLSASNFLDGGAGDDVLRAYCFTDSDGDGPVGINDLSGGNGNDMLQAIQVTDGENSITNVTNHLDGGNGNDVLVADSTALARLSVFAINRLEGGNGNDSLTAHLISEGTSSTKGVDASNELSGGSGNDSLLASIEIVSDPNPSLSDLNLSNTLDGGTGDDYLEASINVVPLHEGPQSLENHLYGGAGNDVLLATIGAGTVGSSFLFGGNGNDQLKVVGGSGNVLNGGEGRDSLTGGIGDDFFFGGKGADTFHFDLSVNQGTDTIGDFESERDILSFAGLIDQGAPGLVDDLNAISTITDSGAGNDVTVDFTAGSHIVFAGLGTGFTDSWSEIVAHPALQLTV